MARKLIIILFISLLTGQGGIAQENDPFSACIDLGEEIIIEKLESENSGEICGRTAGVINAPLHIVWSVLSDYNRFYEFMPRMPVTYLVDKAAARMIAMKDKWKRKELEHWLEEFRTESIEGDTVYFYNVVDMPVPVEDRWYLLKMVRDSINYQVHWTMVIGNMEINRGSWKIKAHPADSRKTLAVYTTCSDSGIPIPRFIQNYGLKKSLPDIINGVRERSFECAKDLAQNAFRR